MDHYKGKKHKKCVDKWLFDHRIRNVPRTDFKKAGNLNTTAPSGIATARIVQAISDVSGNAAPPPPPPPPPPISGVNAIPLGAPGGYRKRPDQNFYQQNGGSSKRFPFGRPPPKKPKADRK